MHAKSTLKIRNLDRWADAVEIRRSLVDDGWVSPNTYSNREYGIITSQSAVYLFLIYNQSVSECYDKAFVGYVGMATNLEQRLLNHSILKQISDSGLWPMKWFKPTEAKNLRETERNYIHYFDPPWNIIGRRRGLVVQ